MRRDVAATSRTRVAVDSVGGLAAQIEQRIPNAAQLRRRLHVAGKDLNERDQVITRPQTVAIRFPCPHAATERNCPIELWIVHEYDCAQVCRAISKRIFRFAIDDRDRSA